MARDSWDAVTGDLVCLRSVSRSWPGLRSGMTHMVFRMSDVFSFV